MFWKPVICDETFKFKSQPINAVPEKPLLIGSNTNEGILFVWLFEKQLANSLGTTVEKLNKPDYQTFRKKMAALFGADAGKIYNLAKEHLKFLKNDFNAVFSWIITNFMFTSGNLYYDYNAAQKNDLFVYYFTHKSSCNFVPFVPACDGKVCHIAELPYIFHTFKAFNPKCGGNISPAELKLADQMSGFLDQVCIK